MTECVFAKEIDGCKYPQCTHYSNISSQRRHCIEHSCNFERNPNKCRFLLEDGGCDLAPMNGCYHTTENQQCGFIVGVKHEI